MHKCFSQTDGGKGKSEEEEGTKQVQDKNLQPATPRAAQRDKNTGFAVSSSAEGPATGAKADADTALLRVPPRAGS